MSATVMSNPSQLPHRKPVPMQRSYNDLQQRPEQQQPSPAQHAGNFSRPSISSSTVPPNRSPNPSDRNNSVYSTQSQQTVYAQPSRRTLSNATSSTSSTNTAGLQRAPTNSNMPRRSTSSRSAGSASPTSYVALMRKQKATVWCDRAQVEDPRRLAQQQAAKMRAAIEVAGGRGNGSRVSTGSNSMTTASTGIRSKIRHQGAPKASAYLGGANMSGAGVPIRLSATEVDENDSDEDYDSKHKGHQRNGSRHSSFGSGQRAGNYLHSGTGSTPPSRQSPGESMGDLAEEETPQPNANNTLRNDYFVQSGDDAEAERSFGGIGGLPQRAPKTEQERKTEDELRRRGSVDDRAMTMSAGRLYVANPDLSD